MGLRTGSRWMAKLWPTVTTFSGPCWPVRVGARFEGGVGLLSQTLALMVPLLMSRVGRRGPGAESTGEVAGDGGVLASLERAGHPYDFYHFPQQ